MSLNGHPPVGSTCTPCRLGHHEACAVGRWCPCSRDCTPRLDDRRRPVARSYNGWTANEDPRAIRVVPLEVAGVGFPGGVRAGDVEAVLAWVARRFHTTVEPLVDGWCWGYAYRQNRNANNISCHASGTAIDCNAPRHPNGKRGTFTAKQVRAIRALVKEAGVVAWGGDFGTPDEMHFEINGDAQAVAAAARRLGGEELDVDESTLRRIIREELVSIVTGGPRRPDRRDMDPRNISTADLYTRLEQVEAKIDGLAK